MTDETGTVRTQQSRPGLIGNLLSLISRIIMFLLGAMLCSVIIEWIGMAFLWPELGSAHSYEMMKTELGWFSNDFTHSLFATEPVKLVGRILSLLNHWLYIDIGLKKFANQPHGLAQKDSVKIQIYYFLKEYALAGLYIVSIFLLRLAVILFSMPLFILAITVGIVDGLVSRDLRKFGCGYESGFIYHHSKIMIIKPLLASGMVYLALPFSIHPLTILLPSALLHGLSISITIRSFKKYI